MTKFTQTFNRDNSVTVYANGKKVWRGSPLDVAVFKSCYGQTTTDKPTRDQIMAVLDNETFRSLACRWADESEYEDIAEYTKVFAKATDLIVHRATKRPFGFIASFKSHPEIKYHFKALSRQIVADRV